MIHRFIHIQSPSENRRQVDVRLRGGRGLFLVGMVFILLGVLIIVLPQLLVALLSGLCFIIGGVCMVLGWKITRVSKRMLDSENDL